MRERSWIITIVQVLTYLGCLILFALLYWSSVLQEERLRAIEAELNTLETQLIHAKMDRENDTSVTPTSKVRKHIDPALPNLLVDDPYFTEVLPGLLPKGFRPQGTLKMAAYGKADDLNPFTQWANVQEWIAYCQGATSKLKFGHLDILAKDLAIKIEERPLSQEDLTSFWVHLREGIMWQPVDPRFFPGLQLAPHFLKTHPVTSYDFQFYFQAFKNPHIDLPTAVTLRELYRDMERIEVVDDLTFIVYYKKIKTDAKKSIYQLPYHAIRQVSSLTPLASFLYKYNFDGKKLCPEDTTPDFYQKSSLWAQYYSRHFAKRFIASCGPWVFNGATDLQVGFKRNRDFYNKTTALYENIEVHLLESRDAIWRDCMAQKIDCCELTPQHLVELESFRKSSFYMNEKKKGNELKSLEYVMRAYQYIGWNLKKPLFSSKRVRQALAMAVDIERLIMQNLNGQGIQVTGPFSYSSPSYDHSLLPLPYDPDAAKRLLAEEGWVDIDGDGVIEKKINGQVVPFRFRITYYIKNMIAKANVEFVCMQLKQVGVDATPYGVDTAELSNTVDDKNFDAYFLAWSGGIPPEDPSQLWSSRNAPLKGSSNTVSFANAKADELIRKLKFEQDLRARNELYHEFQALIYDEQPYLFLYAPKITLVYWNWLKNIFIPKDRQDLLPHATNDEPSVIHGWKEK